MDTDQLLAFQRVVRQGSFSRAARTLGIGQPAISARIQALEAQVGGALLTRGRRIGLTALGASYLPFVERALETLDEGLKSARLSQSRRSGRVTLAALGSLTGGLLGPALERFVAAQPQVECSMRSVDHEFVLQLLADGVVELGIIAWPCRDAAARDLTCLLVLRERVLLAAHPRHPIARRGRISVAELIELGRPFLRLRWWPSHHPELERIAAASASPLEIPMQAARHLTLQGAAVGFFPQLLIGDEIASGALVEVTVHDLPPIERQSALVRRPEQGPPTAAARAFIDHLRQQAKALGLLPRARTPGQARASERRAR
ncbi:MAG TPA: LysR family transcriptional regulator [Polyangiaceae bacterium]|jgi:DNA-binding transcriptional LysR family regulator|nr:LysR family transcriptional regulator [Polyangiaceae bacterium]